MVATSLHCAPAAAPLVAVPIAPASRAIGTFAAPQPERMALTRADALLAQADVATADADAVIEALDAARASLAPIGYDCELAAARLLQKSGRPLAASSRWQRAARAAPLVEHAANAERMAALLAGAAGHRSRLTHNSERWPLRVLGLENWAQWVLAWSVHAPDDEETARAVALVATLGTPSEQIAARALQSARPIGLPRLGDSDWATLVGLALRLAGADAARETLTLCRSLSTHKDAMEWLRLEAEILVRERRYDEANERWHTIASHGTRTEQSRAYGRLGRVLEAQERFAEAAVAFRRASALCVIDAEREEWLYATGVMHVWAGEMDQALGAFERYKNASIIERHTASVLWFSAWAAFRLFDLEHARLWLTELADSGDASLVPQAEYWLGRLCALQGRTPRAQAWYRRAASHPRSYYALLASARLPALQPHRFVQAAIDAVGTDALAWNSQLGRRLAALSGLGLHARALADIASLGPAPGASSAMAALSRAELALQYKDVASASRHADEALRLARERPMAPRWSARAEYLAYPRAEAESVQHATHDRQVTPALLWAVMRQESRFAFDAVSTSGALGLMQLLPKTAHRIAERLHEAPPSPAQLLQPARNVAYGAWYLDGLLADVQQSVPLAVASYNAGPVARDRWLTGLSHQPMDVVLESIPKDETRRYTKVVLQNLATYLRLYENLVPPIDVSLPSSIAHDIDF